MSPGTGRRWKGRRGGQGPPSKKFEKGGAGGGGRLQGTRVFVGVSVCVFHLWYIGTRGSPAMTAGPRLGGEMHVGDWIKEGTVRRRS